MNNATDNQETQFRSYMKKAWGIYILMTIVLIVVLVLFVAQDTEEKFFFTIMPAAAAYVLRPTEKYMGRLIYKFTGFSRPEDNQ